MMAEVLLAVHFAIAAFIVGGLVLVWLGAALGWRWVRNPWYRYAHLAAIAFVALESILGFMCPLTIWEDALRGESDGQGFIQRWIHAWLYWSAPPWVFTTAYVAFALLVAWTWVRHPPRRYAAG